MRDVLDLIDAATDRVLDRVAQAAPAVLANPSRLAGWSRVTVLAHLRYLAGGFLRMTRDALEGHAAAMYPGGRDAVRPATLQLQPGESAEDLVADFHRESTALRTSWRALDEHQWRTTFAEPELGDMAIADLAQAFLTEVEVHGVDLDLGIEEWSAGFVAMALPWRIATLPRLRRRPDADLAVNGSWALSEGVDAWYIVAHGTAVSIESIDRIFEADSVIEGDRRALLALLLGRLPVHALELSGDVDLGRAIKRAFPGP